MRAPIITHSKPHPDTMGIAIFAEADRLDREGRYDEAFALYAEGNRAKRPYLDPEPWTARVAAAVDNIKFAFPADAFAQAPVGHSSPSPIFVIGFPRCGSTLLEQILASHSKVQAMGEILAFVRLADPSGLWRNADHFRDLGAKYLAEVHKLGWRSSARFTDKHLMNHWCVGAIQLALPRATIIHSVRDPADTCLSCFRTNFRLSDGTRPMNDLAEIGWHYRKYRELMDHWAAVLPGRVVDVEHERLVADLPGQARRLVAACGLRWEDGCLRFHENQREVRTSSRDQVTKPIFDESIGRWRRYEKHLGPLFDALGPYAPQR